MLKLAQEFQVGLCNDWTGSFSLRGSQLGQFWWFSWPGCAPYLHATVNLNAHARKVFINPCMRWQNKSLRFRSFFTICNNELNPTHVFIKSSFKVFLMEWWQVYKCLKYPPTASPKWSSKQHSDFPKTSVNMDAGSTCVCTRVWTRDSSESTSKIRMMMRNGLESSSDKRHLSSVMSYMFAQAKKRPFKGCLMFGMSRFSRFSGCFRALAFPIDLFLWVWEQFRVNKIRNATKWDEPFQSTEGCIIPVPTINWDFRDMQTLFL